MYTLLRSLRGLNQTGQNKYMENRGNALRPPLSLSSIRTHAMVNTYKSEKCTMEKKQELAGRAYSVKEKKKPSSYRKTVFSRPCQCSPPGIRASALSLLLFNGDA